MDARPPTVGPEILAGVDEPVRRFLGHAIRDGAPIGHPLRLAMQGRIRVGAWLPFTAQQTIDGASFTWRWGVRAGQPGHVGDQRLARRPASGDRGPRLGRRDGRLARGRSRPVGAPSASTVGGALGSGLESDEAVREAADGQRRRRRAGDASS